MVLLLRHHLEESRAGEELVGRRTGRGIGGGRGRGVELGPCCSRRGPRGGEAVGLVRDEALLYHRRDLS